MAHRHSTVVHADAAQAVGKIPVRVEDLRGFSPSGIASSSPAVAEKMKPGSGTQWWVQRPSAVLKKPRGARGSVIQVWKFPPQRVYATIYQPNAAKNDPAERDQEAWELWAAKFRSVGLDPEIHIVNGGKKDNFWMMGETGPCGPCSELLYDRGPRFSKATRPQDDPTGERFLEFWNLVFMHLSFPL